MRERVTHENHPNTQNLQQQSFTTLFTIYMTHLPSLVEFRGLVPNTGTAEFKLWSLPINTGSYFFYRIPQTDFKLCEGIYHPLPLD